MQNIKFDHSIYAEKSALQLFAVNFNKDADDANDLVQETYPVCKSVWEGYQSQGLVIHHYENTFINEYRRNTKRNSIINTSDNLGSQYLIMSAAKNSAVGGFVSEDILKVLGKLPKDIYIPFTMYLEEYKSWKLPITWQSLMAQWKHVCILHLKEKA